MKSCFLIHLKRFGIGPLLKIGITDFLNYFADTKKGVISRILNFAVDMTFTKFTKLSTLKVLKCEVYTQINQD